MIDEYLESRLNVAINTLEKLLESIVNHSHGLHLSTPEVKRILDEFNQARKVIAAEYETEYDKLNKELGTIKKPVE